MAAKTLSTLNLRSTFRPHASLPALPGAAKTILARQLTAILPATSLAAALETARMHRVALLTAARTAMITHAAVRAPQHTIADVCLIDGGRVPLRGNPPAA